MVRYYTQFTDDLENSDVGNMRQELDELNNRLEGEWVLLNSTLYTVQVQGELRKITIPNLSKYKKICIEFGAGDSFGATTAIIEKLGNGEIPSRAVVCNNNDVNYNAKSQLIVSFNGEYVGIAGRTTGWSIETCGFGNVWGIR